MTGVSISARRRAAMPAIAFVLLAPTLLASARSSWAEPSHSLVNFDSTMNAGIELYPLALSIKTAGQGSLGNVFTSVRLDSTTQMLVVMLTQDDAATRNALGVNVDVASSVAFNVVKHSYNELRTLQDQVTGDSAVLAAAGVMLSRWGLDQQTDRLRLAVVDLTDDKARYLLQRYGSDRVVVVPGVPSIQTLDRYHDSAPWSPGDYVKNGPAFCSAGPSARSAAGIAYMITAGHCFSINSNLTQNGIVMGTVVNRSLYKDNGLDAEAVRTSGGSSANVWRTTTVRARQQQIGHSISQFGMTKSGVTTDEQTGTVQQVDTTENVRDDATGQIFILNHIDTAIGGAQLNGTGDSGGPVYIVQAGGATLTMIGITSSSDGNAAYPGYTLCGNSVVGTQHCFTEVNYTELDRAMSDMGLTTLITS